MTERENDLPLVNDITMHHLAWLHQLAACMNEHNWRDVRGLIEQQTDRLSRHLFPVGELSDGKTEIERLRERVIDAEIALSTWDDGRNSEYWERHGIVAE